MEEIIARLRKDMVALQESNRKDMESLQESKRKDLESLQESSRKDLEWLQESNILLVKERDEQERRAKREVREAARVHKEHQALLIRVDAGEHETEQERYLAAELLETKEALLLSRAEAAQNAGMDLALIEEQEVNCALNSCTLTRTLTLTLTLALPLTLTLNPNWRSIERLGASPSYGKSKPRSQNSAQRPRK